MKQKLVITLDEQTTQKYVEIASAKIAAEIDADCEPSGVYLTIGIGNAAYGYDVCLDGVEIGEADVKLLSF